MIQATFWIDDNSEVMAIRAFTGINFEEDRTVDPLVKLVSGVTEKGLREHFQSAINKANFNKDDVEAGRAYVKAYVEFIHYAERMYEAATKASPGHYTEAEDHETHD